MPRPSCGRYSNTPEGSLAILRNENSSCARQSQRWEVKTSPVRHCEWTRTSGAFCACAFAAAREEPFELVFKLPCWMATASSPDLRPSMPKIRKEPKPVGNLAVATTRALLDFPDCFLRAMGNSNYSRVRKIGLRARTRCSASIIKSLARSHLLNGLDRKGGASAPPRRPQKKGLWPLNSLRKKSIF